MDEDADILGDGTRVFSRGNNDEGRNELCGRRVVAPASRRRFCDVRTLEKSPARRRRHENPSFFVESLGCVFL